jgi:single-stranded DNA-binding protein
MRVIIVGKLNYSTWEDQHCINRSYVLFRTR